MRLSAEGFGSIDPNLTYVVVPLHEGFADVIALLHLPLRLRFAAREELGSWPALGPALRAGGHVMIDPEHPREAYRRLRRAAPVIRAQGDSLVVFPQGTLLGIEAAFTRGAFGVARATGQQILPIVITGSHRVWSHPFSPLVRFDQDVHMRVLAPQAPPVGTSGARDLERTMKAIALRGRVQPRRYRPARDGFWDGYRYTIDPDFADVHAAVAAHRARLSTSADPPIG